ncbi:hypothetical protein DVW87_14615 [Sphingomonas aracearum]|uniref:PhiE125 gp8 family phage protein n=2 Tax=Sphingomonas aracearum TaxID=2283317 RepID=A0A369VTR0_9SPHN|nr:hypothetical protein DVW87_14615 [Sphingomonas aracearum]
MANGLGTAVLGADDRVRATAAVKAALRVHLAEEDGRIGDVAEAALGLAEQFTGRVLLARALTETVAADGCWRRLAARPVRGIAGVEAGGAVLPVESFAVDIDGGGTGWVRVAAGNVSRATVRFTAGMAEGWDALAPPLREGAVLLAAHLFREGEGARVPAAVAALWRPYRTLSLRWERHG